MKYQGILPDDLHDPEFLRECEDHERQRSLEREERAAEAERAADLQGIYDEIEATVLPHIREQAKAVNTAARITPADRKIFEAFRTYCASGWDVPLPPLPGHPAAVAAFLTTQMGHSPAHFMKCLHAISRVHVAVGLPDPAADVLLRSLVRKVRTLNQQEKDD